MKDGSASFLHPSIQIMSFFGSKLISKIRDFGCYFMGATWSFPRNIKQSPLQWEKKGLRSLETFSQLKQATPCSLIFFHRYNNIAYIQIQILEWWNFWWILHQSAGIQLMVMIHWYTDILIHHHYQQFHQFSILPKYWHKHINPFCLNSHWI